MVKVNCNRFREFLKCLEPMGEDLIFQFSPSEIVVKGIGQGNQIIGDVSIEMETGFSGQLGESLEMVKKLLPKEVSDVEIVFGKQSLIWATGYKSTLLSINAESCIRVPKKDLVIDPGEVRVNAQQVYERLQSLKSAFTGQSFTMTFDPELPGVVSFSDFDSSMGSPRHLPRVKCKSLPSRMGQKPCLKSARTAINSSPPLRFLPPTFAWPTRVQHRPQPRYPRLGARCNTRRLQTAAVRP